VGSLRAGSYNRRLAEAAGRCAPDGITVDIFDDLAWPMWPSTTKISTARAPFPPQTGCVPPFESAHALLLVTPEYNSTIPASLKNAIDWISRPYRAGAISGKPLAVIGVSNGR
jgi:NAD(P)H-dependent FMN reductase